MGVVDDPGVLLVVDDVDDESLELEELVSDFVSVFASAFLPASDPDFLA